MDGVWCNPPPPAPPRDPDGGGGAIGLDKALALLGLDAAASNDDDVEGDEGMAVTGKLPPTTRGRGRGSAPLLAEAEKVPYSGETTVKATQEPPAGVDATGNE